MGIKALEEVRPVMDFQKLNHHVDMFTANMDVCAAKLHEWRQKGSNVSLLDLRRAYLQVHVHELLWPFQTVKVDGKRYCLTCLEFELNGNKSAGYGLIPSSRNFDSFSLRTTSCSDNCIDLIFK